MHLKEELNKQQLKAVEFTGKHLLVLAGAGTGKTRTIIARAAYLIENGANPSKIQILTFTKKAANEIVERVKASLPQSNGRSLSGATFHSWCNQLIIKYPNLFGAANFTVIDPDDQLGLMKMVSGSQSDVYSKLRIKPQQLLDVYSYARNTKKNLTESIRTLIYKGKEDKDTDYEITAMKPNVEILLRAYQKKKMDQRYLDYDDLLLVVSTQLKSNPEARKFLSQDLDYLLVDEMQDTNPLQWELLSPFIDICSLFCVGDDAQSIYSFRGADFRNVHQFKERVKDSEVYKLEKNYRSTQEILDISNWLLEKSPIDYKKKLQSVRGNGEIPILLNVNDEWQEANWVADEILKNYTDEDRRFSDHLILSRSQYYTKTLQAVFIRRKIPYVTYGGRKFLQAAHIKDLVSLLRIVNNPYDEIAWVRFLTFWEGIGEVRASRIMAVILADEGKTDIPTLLQGAIPGKDGIKIADLYNAVQKEKGKVGKMVDIAYEAMSLGLAFRYRKDWIEKRKGDFPVLKLLADSYASLGEFIGEGLLDNAEKMNGSPVLSESQLETAEEKDHVFISTIHSAKGLEADVCIVLNVSPKAFPSAWSLDDVDAIEEDRRVLYVALTRAKNRLIITRNTASISAIHGKAIPANMGQQTNAAETYFLTAVPDTLVKQETIGHDFRPVKDAAEPNNIDLSSGMDFS
ncbi:DNA helicase-2 / ATP-dependent DNA helicase PcrA [Maribacter dokdonensis]|uniref:DNA 3'-5' helicase n=1 Tax=Maribacter dokdonensis TaxID=320912 RepID=A0A1H4RCU3_9FLAO|nr:ATP-dependent helicase [Maribacter dokdonensis]SEC29656.1 DNA helicase-2 / ATP-dependent DNA helicase PcrA [Maribacter dokdonensis]